MTEHEKAWYEQKRADLPAAVFAAIDTFTDTQRNYRDKCRHLMALRNGSPDITGDGLYLGDDGRLRYNLVSSTIDTMLSIVSANRPIPQAVVKAGDWDLQRRAKLRTRTLQTLGVELGLFELMADAYDDACTTAIGAIEFLRNPDSGGPMAERVLPNELAWDPIEAYRGTPRTLTRKLLVDREQLAALYPSKASDIRKSRSASREELIDAGMRYYEGCDMVPVAKAWHLPSSSRSTDGLHVICTDTALLHVQDWTRPRFPIAFFRWAKRQVGFLGRSLADEVRGAQARIHNLIKFVERCQDLGSVPRVFVNGMAEVTEEDIDNLEMSVIRYAGDQPPTFFTFDATPQDLVAEIDRIREQVWSEKGISQAQVQGEKPAGVSSAVGMRTVDDIASRRHSRNIRQFEQDCLRCYECLVDLLDDIADEDPSFEVAASVRAKFLETSRWGELRLSEGDARIAVFPISQLPTTPGARYDRIEELVQQGWITQEFALQLHGLPDLEAYEDLHTADLRLAQAQVARILGGELNVRPDVYQNLAVAADYARRRYVSELEDGLPDELALELRAYIDAIKAKQDEIAAAIQPPVEATPAGPAAPEAMGAPMQAPMPGAMPAEPPIAAE